MVLAVLGSLGGVVAFITAIFIVVRAIFKNVDAVKDNTGALEKLTARMDRNESTLNGHGERIARLEGLQYNVPRKN